MANHPEQAPVREDDLSLFEQIALAHMALHEVPDAISEVSTAKPQPKPEIADPSEGLDGPYGVNVD